MKLARKEVEKSLQLAVVPRSSEGGEEGNKAEQTSPPHGRRETFVKKLERLMPTVYKVRLLTFPGSFFLSGGGRGLGAVFSHFYRNMLLLLSIEN